MRHSSFILHLTYKWRLIPQQIGSWEELFRGTAL